jgi:hypothetical protein
MIYNRSRGRDNRGCISVRSVPHDPLKLRLQLITSMSRKAP